MDSIKLFAYDTSDTLTYTGSSIVLYRNGKQTIIQLTQISSFEVSESRNGRKPGRVIIRTTGGSAAFVQLTSSITVGGTGSEIKFYFDPVCNDKALQIRDYIAAGVSNTSNNNAFSAADEIKKFKELLDMGAITEDEYNAKKKQLLGL